MCPGELLLLPGVRPAPPLPGPVLVVVPGFVGVVAVAGGAVWVWVVAVEVVWVVVVLVFVAVRVVFGVETWHSVEACR